MLYNTYIYDDIIKSHNAYVTSFKHENLVVYLLRKDLLPDEFKETYKTLLSKENNIIYSRYSQIKSSIKRLYIKYYNDFYDDKKQNIALINKLSKTLFPNNHLKELAEQLSCDGIEQHILSIINEIKEYGSALDIDDETLTIDDDIFSEIQSYQVELNPF